MDGNSQYNENQRNTCEVGGSSFQSYYITNVLVSTKIYEAYRQIRKIGPFTIIFLKKAFNRNHS